jgi:putative colanic acid biosynthesis acetyltransferase WcaF
MDDTRLIAGKTAYEGATFHWQNRLERLLWNLVHLLLIRPSPIPAHRYRASILRMFGARVSPRAYVYPDVVIWLPRNLVMEEHATLGRGVRCYNIAMVRIGGKAVVSQGAHLCTGTHDYTDPDFPLQSRPIHIGPLAWICADAFVGPGVRIAEGAVLAATATTFRDLSPWTVYAGNPATAIKARPVVHGRQETP